LISTLCSLPLRSRSSENYRYSGIHDLGNGIRGGYDADGSYVLHVWDSAGSNSFCAIIWRNVFMLTNTISCFVADTNLPIFLTALHLPYVLNPISCPPYATSLPRIRSMHSTYVLIRRIGQPRLHNPLYAIRVRCTHLATHPLYATHLYSRLTLKTILHADQTHPSAATVLSAARVRRTRCPTYRSHRTSVMPGLANP
jgi:hypothetical protein